MNEDQLRQLLHSLISLPTETEWVDFKVNNASPDEIAAQIAQHYQMRSAKKMPGWKPSVDFREFVAQCFVELRYFQLSMMLKEKPTTEKQVKI